MTPRRVIVHAGFHKTATTTVQKYLRANGPHIWPRSALVLPGRTRGNAARMAVRYSRFGDTGLIDAFGESLRTTLAALDVGRSRKVLISDENLSGRMPGRDGQVAYGATAELMARAEEVIHDVFGMGADVVFHFSLRDPADWLTSTYRHNLRVSRLTLSAQDYAKTFQSAADLRGVAQQVADRVAGRVQVRDVAGLDGPEGPAAPLIDLLDLPDHLRRRLRPLARQNVGPSGTVLDEFLALNRSDLPDDRLQAAKDDLIRKAVTDDT